MGELERSGIGRPVDVDPVNSIDELEASCHARNKSLVRQLKDQCHADELMAVTWQDAALGRMTEPQRVEECDLSQVLLHPRFDVEQLKPDGSLKVRAVDHFSWSTRGEGRETSVNGMTCASEKLAHDTLDDLASALVSFVTLSSSVPGLLKADIDSAFRRVPVKPEHRWLCGVAFRKQGQVVT